MRTDYCGLIDTKYLNRTVTLYGWVHRRRDHGGVIFVDLRDREGLVQVVCDPDNADTFGIAEKIRNEFVLKVEGRVRHRPLGTVNPNLVSGEIEVLVHSIEILNPSLTPPFLMDDENLSESVRLEDALHYDEPPAWMIPARHVLGAALMKAGKAAEAEQVYRDDLKKLPNNGWSLYGLADSLRKQGKSAEAAAVDARFKEVWSKADIQITTSCLCQQAGVATAK